MNNSSHDYLNANWTFWLSRRSPPGCDLYSYLSNLRFIYTVYDKETLNFVLNNIPRVGHIPNRFSYHFMRHKYRPCWEDEENIKGGDWCVECNKKISHDMWVQLLKLASSENVSNFLSTDDKLIGVSISSRNSCDLIRLWNQNALRADQCRLLDYLKVTLPDVDWKSAKYNVHMFAVRTYQL
ncbi:hypothetical protein GJ496_006514 [Pomphorhynchus laevis]|nr:hypothetical protein GJ496_006514 [Pomphorhynchus laevis]